jgi:hypothetical protein
MANIQARRAHAFEIQRGRCCYCQQPMWLADMPAFARTHGLTLRQALRFRCTAEHLQARTDGGGNGAPNIAAACLWCNTRRHRRKRPPSPADFRALVLRRMKLNRWHGQLVAGARSEKHPGG